MIELAAALCSEPTMYCVPAGTRSRTSTRAVDAPLTSTGVLVGAATLLGCASCEPMFAPDTAKSIRVVPGITKPGYDALLVMAMTATLPTVTTSWLTAVRLCSAVVATSARQALPAPTVGTVPWTRSAAVWPGCKRSAPALFNAMTGSLLSTTPLLLLSRTMRSEDRSSVSGVQPTPLLLKLSV